MSLLRDITTCKGYVRRPMLDLQYYHVRGSTVMLESGSLFQYGIEVDDRRRFHSTEDGQEWSEGLINHGSSLRLSNHR